MRVRFCPLFASLTLLFSSLPMAYAKEVTPEPAQSKAWELLHTGLKHGHADQRCQAIHALGLLSQENEAVRLAEEALQDKDTLVRTAAATALGEMQAISSIPQLNKALTDPKVSVAMAAAHSLVELKSPAGYEVYNALLTGKRKGGQGFMVQQHMEMLGEPRKMAVFSLEEGVTFAPYGGVALGAVKAINKDKDGSPVRAAAALALVNDPDPQSGQTLAQAAHDHKWVVRAAALWALAKRDDPSYLPVAEAALSDQNEAVRDVAAAAVLRLSKAQPLESARN